MPANWTSRTVPPVTACLVTVTAPAGSPGRVSNRRDGVGALNLLPLEGGVEGGVDGGVDGGVGAMGVAGSEAGDAELVPTALVAETVTVCAVPLVRPVMVQVSAPVVLHVAPPGVAVAV